MSELTPVPLEGVIVDDSERWERLCLGMVEGMTEFDWEPGHPNSLPEHLREGLRRWAQELKAWDCRTTS